MKIPTLSIITPVFNGELHIESCLRSVIDQHCPGLEHIIVDGKSRDKTVEIIKRYAALHPHIRWISEEDRGQSDAMNKGVRLSQGMIIGVLNVDDRYEQNTLKRVLEIFRDAPEPSFIAGACRVWNENGEIYLNKPEKLNYHDLLLHEKNPHPYNPSAYFYHKSLHEKIGDYNINEHYVLDVDFILRAVKVAHLRYVDEVWGNYYFLKGTKTFTDIQSGSSRVRIAELLESHLQQLPWSRRYRIRWLRFWSARKGHYHYVGKRLLYYILHPTALVNLLRKNGKVKIR